jgi:hypothetical protein
MASAMFYVIAENRWEQQMMCEEGALLGIQLATCNEKRVIKTIDAK